MSTRTLKPKTINAVLLAGTVVLVGGSIFAATRAAPSHSGGSQGLDRRAHATVATAHAEAPGPVLSSAPVLSTVTYRVRPGDGLSDIARWFKEHGYGALFSINEPVLHSQPDGVRAGELITITDGVMILREADGRALPSTDGSA